MLSNPTFFFAQCEKHGNSSNIFINLKTKKHLILVRQMSYKPTPDNNSTYYKKFKQNWC